jgi:hypothetical protein
MTLTMEQVQRLLDAHNCGILIWPYHGIERLSARHAVAKLGFELIAARQRIARLEGAIKAHKAKMASPNYAACLDDNADLWEMVNDDFKEVNDE